MKYSINANFHKKIPPKMASFRLKDFNEIFEKLSIPSLIRIREVLEKAVFEIVNKVIVKHLYFGKTSKKHSPEAAVGKGSVKRCS